MSAKPPINQTHHQLMQWLMQKQFSIHFQPIVHVPTHTIQGYEALTRIPSNENIKNSEQLFQCAVEANQIFRLEKLTRELAIDWIEPYLHSNQKLWVNLTPAVIHDESFTPGFTHSVLKKSKISPAQVVFEITEQSAAKDLKGFRMLLNHYRDQGFQIAIDDVGSGYSSLQLISELKPDFLKVDRSLVTNINQLPEKQYMLEGLQHISYKMDSLLIAEGVETEKEFNQLTSMGVQYIQGYFIAKPAFPPPKLSFSLIHNMQSKHKIRFSLTINERTTLHDVVHWMTEYEGQFNQSFALVDTINVRAVIPLLDIIRFAGSLLLSLGEWEQPVWEKLLEWRKYKYKSPLFHS
ncbi:EAL domain-containing protein [Halobacillus salinarum]|uniref:EAL domain-containing protein n=1 Tax=Halobacillus salinarum TaxID=2932257 RepID=A0ABY4EGY9_9BACI|nr:EAL domain-containing protein [Halobacillus salinarum]UOQ43414.1 EAL domain-containing protein [Halobacillus salinarum]